MERMLPQRYENTRQHQVPLLSEQAIATKDSSKAQDPVEKWACPSPISNSPFFARFSKSMIHASVKAPYVKLPEHVLSDRKTATGPFRERWPWTTERATLGEQGGNGLAEKDQHTLVAGCSHTHTQNTNEIFFFLSFFLSFLQSFAPLAMKVLYNVKTEIKLTYQ